MTKHYTIQTPWFQQSLEQPHALESGRVTLLRYNLLQHLKLEQKSTGKCTACLGTFCIGDRRDILSWDSCIHISPCSVQTVHQFDQDVIQKAFEPSGSLAIAVSIINHTTDLVDNPKTHSCSGKNTFIILHPTWTVLRVQRSDTTSRDQPRCPEAMFLHSGLRIDPKEQAHQDLRPPQQSSQNIRCTAKCRAEFGLDPAIQSPL